MEDPTWSTRWRRYHIYWLTAEFRFLDSMLFEDLFKLNPPTTTSIFDNFFFQEDGMMAYNDIVILKKIEVVSHDFLRIFYKVSPK